MELGFLAHSTWGGVYLVVLGTSFLTSLLLTPVVRWYSHRIDFLDIPNWRASHSKPTPLGGGVAIAMAFLVSIHVGVFAAGTTENSLAVILFGGLVVLTLGVIDDYRGGISAVVKLIALSLLTFLLWWWDDRLVLKIFPWVGLNLLFTLLWIVGVTSAINAIDNMNGLSVGFVAVAAAAYFSVAVINLSDRVAFPGLLNRFWALVALALFGSCLGFLPYNFPRGRIFIGDAGSFFLGYNLAVAGVMGEWSDHSAARASIPLIILALPLFDLGFVVFTRYYTGVTRSLVEAIRHCDRDHLSHRLVRLGLSQVQSVLILHAIATILGVSAVLLAFAETWPSTIGHLIQASLVLIILAILVTVGNRDTGLAGPEDSEPSLQVERPGEGSKRV